MVVPIERLLRRVRRPSSRTDELIALRRRLAHERQSPLVDDNERGLARDVLDRKLAAARALAGATSCASCAIDDFATTGYRGGACCGGNTHELFDDRELAALAHAGTRVRDLTPPANDQPHVGCAFRGRQGCSLAVAHRPARCVHYLCDAIRRELFHRGSLDDVEHALAALSSAMERYTAVHRDRGDREVLAPLIAALAAAARQ